MKPDLAWDYRTPRRANFGLAWLAYRRIPA
jgi:hypothetical protein